MKIGKNWKKLEKIGKNGSSKKMWFLKDVVPSADFMCFNFVVHERRNGGSEIGENWWKIGENGWKWVKMGENGWKWVKMGENWVKIGENWKFHFYAFLVIFCHFGWFQAILVHFVPFVKGVVPFLKGDGQLVKGADSLKLLSKLAVFPLLLIFDEIFSGFRAKFQKRVTSVDFQSNLRKQIRKLPKFLKFVKIIQFYSILFNIIQSCP